MKRGDLPIPWGDSSRNNASVGHVKFEPTLGEGCSLCRGPQIALCGPATVLGLQM